MPWVPVQFFIYAATAIKCLRVNGLLFTSLETQHNLSWKDGHALDQVSLAWVWETLDMLD